MSRLAIFLDTGPLQSGHAIRGIGAYTAQLREQLTQLSIVRLVTSPEEADVIHYPFFDLFYPTLPLRSSKPRVVTIHDVIPLQFPEQYPVGFRGRVGYWRQRLSLSSVQAIITDSHASAKQIHDRLGVPEKKIHPIYLAANPAMKVPPPRTLSRVRRFYDLPDEYLLYVGDINYNKNLPALLRALALLPTKVHLVCVGKNFFPQPIPEWSAIAETLQKEQLEKRVHFLNEVRAVDTDELAAIYHQARAYIQPSLSEGFGLPVLEAMRCEVPVIAARNSSLIEVAGEHALLVEPTPQQLAQAVRTVREWSPAKRATISEAAQRWQETFSWEKTAEETVAVYQKVCNVS